MASKARVRFSIEYNRICINILTNNAIPPKTINVNGRRYTRHIGRTILTYWITNNLFYYYRSTLFEAFRYNSSGFMSNIQTLNEIADSVFTIYFS